MMPQEVGQFWGSHPVHAGHEGWNALFGGKKSDKDKTKPPPSPSGDKKGGKVPTVEDKYIMKDVLGT